MDVVATYNEVLSKMINLISRFSTEGTATGEERLRRKRHEKSRKSDIYFDRNRKETRFICCNEV